MTIDLDPGDEEDIAECRATWGEVSNSEHNLRSLVRPGLEMARRASDRQRCCDESSRSSSWRWGRKNPGDGILYLRGEFQRKGIRLENKEQIK